MKITDKIEFDELNPLLSKQTDEFRTWFNEKINSQITDKTVPDSLDEYDRPASYTLQVEGLTVKVSWVYIYENKSSWACSDFNLEIL